MLLHVSLDQVNCPLMVRSVSVVGVNGRTMVQTYLHMSGVLEAGHAVDGVSVTTLELEERGQANSSVPGLGLPPVAHGDPHWLQLGIVVVFVVSLLVECLTLMFHSSTFGL